MKKACKITLVVSSLLFTILLILVVGFLIFASSYYEADENVYLVLEEYDIVKDDYITLLPQNNDINKEIIFYPGAKVEFTSYLPLLNQFRDFGFSVTLLKMPLNFAFLGINRAEDFISKGKETYLMGHSLGGAMASSFASSNEEKVDGLIVLGSYVYGDYPIEKALTIYGSFNTNLEDNIDYEENIVLIEGANHAQFGNYGKQKGDPDATISAYEQQEITFKAVMNFITAF